MSVQLDGKWSWVYLVNLVFYLVPLFYLPLEPWQIAVAVAVFEAWRQNGFAGSVDAPEA